MRLVGVAWQGYALPFRSRYVTSSASAAIRYGLLVFLKTDTDLLGVGEASPVGSGSQQETRGLAETLDRLAPRLLGTSISTTEADLAGDAPSPLRFGLETALLDIQGKASERPVAELLGGKPSSLPVNAIIAAETPERAAAETAEAARHGFTSLKLKVGHGTPAQDEALVSAVRQAVGPNVKLRLDPNQAWEAARAIESIGRLSRYGLEYVEQPVAAGDIAGLAQTRRAVPVPIAADESLGSLDDLRRLLAADAADVFILKPARLGGLRAALEVAHIALEADKPVVVTSSLESSVGIAACAHLAAALPSQPFAHGLATGLLFEEDLTSSDLRPENGVLRTPSGPGLGVEVNTACLEKYGSGIKGSTGSWSWW
ncbi:MAG: o-succinylbenzoate synthase [Chloroflexi bacterium]|nr:o-succinylbenzoate synthase [Chloroflexota bacterium]